MQLPPSGTLRVVVGLLGLGAALVAVLILIPVPAADRVLTTRGPLEIASVLLLAGAAAMAALRNARTREVDALAAAWILALFTWMKLDPGDWLLSRNAESPGFYLDAAVPVGERIVLALLLGGGALLVLYLVARLFPAFRVGWRKRDAVAVWGGAAVVLLALSIIVDYYEGTLTWARGYREPGMWPKHHLNVLEETLELLASALFALAAGAAARRGSAAGREAGAARSIEEEG